MTRPDASFAEGRLRENEALHSSATRQQGKNGDTQSQRRQIKRETENSIEDQPARTKLINFNPKPVFSISSLNRRTEGFDRSIHRAHRKRNDTQ